MFHNTLIWRTQACVKLENLDMDIPYELLQDQCPQLRKIRILLCGSSFTRFPGNVYQAISFVQSVNTLEEANISVITHEYYGLLLAIRKSSKSLRKLTISSQLVWASIYQESLHPYFSPLEVSQMCTWPVLKELRLDLPVGDAEYVCTNRQHS